ncbi:hypothetical protein E1281_04520 [Actinomadura sp. KC345]|uniref:RNA polymerase sigma factor n=1 Tax=Actinomadura sp. KC345 TaxID=2530371 RepID=UPI001043B1E1|nr:hypothetical protein [Actinomadura sp. KC345]TDC57582.1 hypothetical protein E1281_04520 [Actinomadura sp. KC345]
MRGDMGSLYDAHADRLYAYCWSLVGDQLAAAAVGDAFTAAVRQPPRGDSVLWLYSLARSACTERGAFAGHLDGRGGMLFAGSDPLLRAAGALRPDHREVLLLWASEWLEPHDIARVLGIAPDTVVQLLDAARIRLERSVLEILMRGTTEARHDLITAFEKKRLPRLLADRAPARAPGWLRDRVLAACEDEAVRPLPSVTVPSPLVVIGPDRPHPGRRGGTGANPKRGLSGGLQKGIGAAAGVAASVAAVVGLLATWPSAKGGAGAASMVPTASNGQTNPASTTSTGVPRHPMPGLSGTEKATGGPPGTPRDPATSGDPAPPAGGTPDGAAPPATSPPGGPSRETGSWSPGTPSRPDRPSAPPTSGSPTTPPTTPDDPTTPPGDGSGTPTTPPPDTPTDPPEEPGTPGPSPTANPTPSPSGN